MDELIEKRWTNALDVFDNYVYMGIQIIIGLMLQKAEYYHMIEGLLNYMENHPAEYPTYMESEEYRLKTSGKYENKKQHPTFFFGG
jgi:hypothetical protein